MKKQYRIGSLSGIDIFLHWSFVATMLFLFVFALFKGASLVSAFAGLTVLCVAFGCVVLHEMGHALMARRFGIPTQDITLYPIGGVARLRSLPRDPAKEFWIAIAGPAVNLAIAGALFLVNNIAGNEFSVSAVMASFPNLIIGQLILFNLSMVGFNMLPAFPLDGGRVLRAGLASQMSYSRATQIAGFIGMVMAGFMALYGLFSYHLILVAIALFIVMAAKQEIEQAIMK